MVIDGVVDLQISTQNVGAFDAFYNSVKVSICNLKLFITVLLVPIQ